MNEPCPDTGASYPANVVTGSRLPAVPAAPFVELAPGWACDVVSPGSERSDRERKLPIYAREHVSHVCSRQAC